METERFYPVALTIAGSDSGGGAGIQADLKTFSAFQVFGTSVITCVTAQNPARVDTIECLSRDIIQSQLKLVVSWFPIGAVKTGMLFSKEIIATVGSYLAACQIPVVVDPVMVATSGKPLLQMDAMQALKTYVFPYATLLTPNIYESEVLAEMKIQSSADMQKAAIYIHQKFGVAVVVKGGHRIEHGQANDYFFDGTEGEMLSAPWINDCNTHGTGCTFSAAITALLAKKFSLYQSIVQAKKFVTQAIRQALPINDQNLLSHFIHL